LNSCRPSASAVAALSLIETLVKEAPALVLARCNSAMNRALLRMVPNWVAKSGAAAAVGFDTGVDGSRSKSNRSVAASPAELFEIQVPMPVAAVETTITNHQTNQGRSERKAGVKSFIFYPFPCSLAAIQRLTVGTDNSSAWAMADMVMAPSR
jgi:hypothetical protein